MIASNSVILAERPALARSPVVHGLGRVVPSHTRGRRALEYKERIAILNLRRVFQLAAEGDFRCAAPEGASNFEELTGIAKAMP
jgi:hypothetical protein